MLCYTCCVTITVIRIIIMTIIIMTIISHKNCIRDSNNINRSSNSNSNTQHTQRSP